MKDAIGWAASIVVLVTLVAQIVKQWKSDSSRGVSPWLFVGEIASALLFLWYAVTIHNAVYITTNTLMAIASCLGLGILIAHRRRGHGTSTKRGQDAPRLRRSSARRRSSSRA